jgi:hypothetical protein
MKSQTLLNFILATVIVVLLFYIRSSAERKEYQPALDLSSPADGNCRYNDIGGFAGAINVSKTTAREQAQAYETFAISQGSQVFGGVISKAALDSLFCNGNFNGLSYKLAMDPTAKHGVSKAVFVIIGGVNVKDNVVISQGNSFYTNNLWCPPSCLSFE